MPCILIVDDVFKKDFHFQAIKVWEGDTGLLVYMFCLSRSLVHNFPIKKYFIRNILSQLVLGKKGLLSPGGVS